MKDPPVHSRRSWLRHHVTIGMGTLRRCLRMFRRAVWRVKVAVGDEQGHGTEQVLTAQVFILILTMGTGANAITHPVRWDAVPSVMA